MWLGRFAATLGLALSTAIAHLPYSIPRCHFGPDLASITSTQAFGPAHRCEFGGTFDRSALLNRAGRSKLTKLLRRFAASLAESYGLQQYAASAFRTFCLLLVLEDSLSQGRQHVVFDFNLNVPFAHPGTYILKVSF
jgi:hypothetical protein